MPCPYKSGTEVGDGVGWSCALDDWGIFVVLGTVRAGAVHDDGDVVVVGVVVRFVVDGGKSLEELLNDVGEDGGFPCGDAVLGERTKSLESVVCMCTAEVSWVRSPRSAGARLMESGSSGRKEECFWQKGAEWGVMGKRHW
jgi:hypothetical protein